MILFTYLLLNLFDCKTSWMFPLNIFVCKIKLTESSSLTLEILFQVSEKGFRRLTPDQSVGLKYAGMVIKLDKIVKVGYFLTLPLSKNPFSPKMTKFPNLWNSENK